MANKSALQTCVECIKDGYSNRSRFKMCNLTTERCIQTIEIKSTETKYGNKNG